MSLFRISFLTLLFGVLTAGAAEKVRVSSFSTILTEIAQQVGDDHVAVTAHVKPGADPHEFEPKPADLKAVAEAQLILLSAKHMESYVPKLKESAGAKGNIVQVGDQFRSLKMKPEDEGDGKGGGQEKEIEDPHWWHSISNMQRATAIVRDELIKIDPADKADFTANADKYIASLAALQKWVKSEVAKLPRNQRKLVTSHDAFQYFAHDYGFTIYPIEGVTPEDQPSSKKVAKLISIIKEQGVKAIFPETIENPKVLTEITRESGAKVGGQLTADGLGEGETATYDGMMRHNVSTIVNALK
jgi:zinc/manganese transport system substrate-binding protein